MGVTTDVTWAYEPHESSILSVFMPGIGALLHYDFGEEEGGAYLELGLVLHHREQEGALPSIIPRAVGMLGVRTSRGALNFHLEVGIAQRFNPDSFGGRQIRYSANYIFPALGLGADYELAFARVRLSARLELNLPVFSVAVLW